MEPPIPVDSRHDTDRSPTENAEPPAAGDVDDSETNRTPAIPPLRPHDPLDMYSAFREPDYRLYWIGNVLSVVGLRMQFITLSWEVYERTRDPLSLGLIGLTQVVPVIALALVAGAVADRFERRKVLMVSAGVVGLATLAMGCISLAQLDIRFQFGLLLASAMARAFQQPAKSSLVPQLVPREKFANAVTWGTSGFQLASIVGPAIAGLLIGLTESVAVSYFVQTILAFIFVGVLTCITRRPVTGEKKALSIAELTAGIRFLVQSPVLLGAMLLDMFAVLFGGAVAMLPVYAKDILHVGATGLGQLQTADAIGALVMSYFIARYSPLRNAGRNMLLSVAAFGIATIGFGLSRWFPLSLLLLFFVGAFDMVSVVVRQTLLQLLTPDELRGRVSAVNGLFVSISNELGAFESGLVAAFGGATFSVVSGGVGTIIIVMLVAICLPPLRRHRVA